MALCIFSNKITYSQLSWVCLQLILPVMVERRSIKNWNKQKEDSVCLSKSSSLYFAWSSSEHMISGERDYRSTKLQIFFPSSMALINQGRLLPRGLTGPLSICSYRLA